MNNTPLAIPVLLKIILACCRKGSKVLVCYRNFQKSFYCTVCILAVLCVICVSISMCINGMVPLVYELACEITYPVYEGIPASLITIVNSLTAPLFFGLFLIPPLAQGECTMPALIYMAQPSSFYVYGCAHWSGDVSISLCIFISTSMTIFTVFFLMYWWCLTF